MKQGKRQARRTQFLGGLSVAIFLALIAIVFAFPQIQQVALRSPQIAAVVSAVLVDITNSDRAQEGLGELRVEPVLVAIAQMKANDMAIKGYFAHVSPEGLDPWHWFRLGGYRYAFAGENLAINFSDSEDVVRAWMNSPKHRENILDGRFTEIGIATAVGVYEGRETIFVAQVFGAPKGNPLSAAVPVTSATVPERPTEIAFASGEQQPRARVLSESIGEAPLQPAAVASAVTIEPAVAAALAEESSAKDTSVLGYVFGYPKETMHIAFYILAGLVLLALAVDTGFEIKWHHRRRAIVAAVLLALIVVLFLGMELFLFVGPQVAGR